MDYDVRLGLTPADLQLREISVKRPDEWVDLNPDDCVELRLIQENFPGSVVQTRLFRGEKTIIIGKAMSSVSANCCAILLKRTTTTCPTSPVSTGWT